MSVDANDPHSDALVGFWDFRTGAEACDTSRVDARTQNSQTFADSFVVDGGLFLDGRKDYFSNLGDEDPFGLQTGSVRLSFVQTRQPNSVAQILISRGEFKIGAVDGYFSVAVASKGCVEVCHISGTTHLSLRTQTGLFDTGERVEIAYGWSATEGGSLMVRNLVTGAAERIDFATVGLTFEAGDEDGESFIIGAQEVIDDPNICSKYFDGTIDYVAVYNRDILNDPAALEKAPGAGGNVPTGLALVGDQSGVVLSKNGDEDAFGKNGNRNDALKRDVRDNLLDGDSDHDGRNGCVRNDSRHGADGHDPLLGVQISGDHAVGEVAGARKNMVSEPAKPAARDKNDNSVSAVFTPRMLIATPQGERPIEDLSVGDEVITRENGIQKINWVGARGLTGAELKRGPHLNPVQVAKGALGDGLPERDMMLSPNTRVLVSNDKTALYFEEPEVLVAAKHLTALRGISMAAPRWVRYVQVMFAHHEMILLNGSWTESFQPNDDSLEGIGNAQRLEIQELFPELEVSAGRASQRAARNSLKRYEAQLLRKG